jgi:hypothetical protein
MASIKQTQGTTLTWTSSGGDHVLDLGSLANAAGRQGDKHDFTATFPECVRIELLIDFNVAPTAGNTVDVYWSSSDDGTDFDGECAGSDGAYSTQSDTARLHFVGCLSASASTSPQRASWVFYLPARYGVPVVRNSSGQALTSVGTDQVLTVTPLVGDIN